MTMTIDELIAQVAQLDWRDQEELLQRLLMLRSFKPERSVLPSAVSGAVWLAQWEHVRIDPAVADELEQIINTECERIGQDDWQ